MTRSEPTRLPPGFTLVELVIVMALLAVCAALTVPTLARSVRARYLKDEAARFLAATEYGRNEAVSQGVPMVVWIDPSTQHFGVEPKAGYQSAAGRERDFALGSDLSFEIDQAATRGSGSGSQVDAVEFSPDGAPTLTSIETVRLVDRSKEGITIVKSADGWAYEIVKEAR
jgi:type II secretion system protein H